MEHNVLGVMFEVTKKRYNFEVIGDEQYKKGEKVIVDTVRGQEIGTVYAEVRVMDEKALVSPLKPVIRKANKNDTDKYDKLREDAKKAYEICKKKIFEHNLPMKLITAEYTFDKNKLIFYFTAEGRIDFRNLVKDLASSFRLRIELRQIGVRDEARILGGFGICGHELCCRKFIDKFDSVSIKMGREQGLVINPSKISGVCGRLLCCMKYEYEQYKEILADYPAVGQRVETPSGRGKTINLNPLNGYIYVDVKDKGVNKFNIDEIAFDKEEAKQMKESHNLGEHGSKTASLEKE
ncbi:PSP1 domain-containing protein [Haliovirga abyssi]|uniref:Stage 0 sporulation protein YaaT n=1 Tax=Haliovirga abyssi TaxID=2996794 RepID=A0AAU9DWL5_9FUSO|nr:stage 0 sporulation protein YaaT [Haliovirga abyssi]